ncbi:hypothetical protein PG991_009965 [Apiospora marii]|uniref:Laccase n=1 Tax=Apiospora marii TaxID=335849 RepID=A0ABR1RIB8_9PEZI
MGWFKVTLEFVLQVTQLNPFSAVIIDQQDAAQKPLRLPKPGQHGPSSPSIPGVDVHPKAAFECHYPELEAKGWEQCNTETSRDCWIRDPTASAPSFTQYDVRTNYETLKNTPKGITREYWLDVTENSDLKPDGVEKTLGKYLNGTYPGPLIEACWGDDIVIHVTNKIQENGTTIHWHGIRQLGTNEMDGVNGVTQCPIALDDTFTYRFKAMQYGHTWYHSHYSSQYPDGVAGPLVIHGPSSADWDIDLGPMMISDWVHETAFVAYEKEMTTNPADPPPATDSIVVNGIGHYNGSMEGPYYETLLTPGKNHTLKLINGAVGSSFVFRIDDHPLTVIANDLVPVEPFTVDELFIGIGQRYTVIVEGKSDTSKDYWIRTQPAANCAFFGLPTDPATPIVDERTAIVRYDSSRTDLPTNTTGPPGNRCEDVDPAKLNPIVPWCVDQHPQNNVTRDTFEAGKPANQTIFGPPGAPYVHWVLGDEPMWLNFDKPTILNIDESIHNPHYRVVEGTATHPIGLESPYLLLLPRLTFDGREIRHRFHLRDSRIFRSNQYVSTPLFGGIRPPFRLCLLTYSRSGRHHSPHPMHLHGSDFVVLGQGNTTWNETTSPEQWFRYDNPPRRDTALLPAGGFLAMAFRPDNPGAWLLHCHIAWHASSGLALQLLVRPSGIPKFPRDHEVRRGCKKWVDSALWQQIKGKQDDSGI